MIQLGTRWPFGATPPARLDGTVADALTEFEQTLRAEFSETGLDGAMWTLTWLEGRPTATLDRDRADGSPAFLSVDAQGRIVTTETTSDDTW